MEQLIKDIGRSWAIDDSEYDGMKELNFRSAMGNASAICLEKTRDPSYDGHLFAIERDFNYWPMYNWLMTNWHTSFYIVAIYLLLIAAGQRLMRNRKPFNLRWALFLWNLGLASFSIFATFRFVPEQIYIIRKFGFHYSVCRIGSVEHVQACAFWCTLFAFSKVLELGDTAFIVLRKQRLIFLHWYHHITVLLFVWSAAAYPSAIQRWYIAVNYLVHSVMYSYYTLKVLRVRVPKTINMAITSLQLVQMVVGITLTTYAVATRWSGHTCCLLNEVVVIAATVYLSYFLLFLNFFLKAYTSKRSLFEVAALDRKESNRKDD